MIKVDMKEILLFLLFMGMMLLIIVMFHYSAVNNEITLTSRCVREKQKGRKSGSYFIQAMNEKNEPLYKVTYRPKAKEYKVDCACTPGSVANTFNQIKVYDMRSPNAPVKYIDSQNCYCDAVVEPTGNTYYAGYPDLLRFMYNGDTSFFKTA
jgi:hypothetical protein